MSADLGRLSDLQIAAAPEVPDDIPPAEVVIYAARLGQLADRTGAAFLELCPHSEAAPASRENAVVWQTQSPYVLETLRRLGWRATGDVGEFQPPLLATLTRVRGHLVIQ